MITKEELIRTLKIIDVNLSLADKAGVCSGYVRNAKNAVEQALAKVGVKS